MCAWPTEPCPNQTSAAGAAANYSQDGPDLNSTSDQIANYVCWSFLKTHTYVFCHCIETLPLKWILQRMTVLSTLLSKRLGTVVAQVNMVDLVNMVLFNVVVKGPAWSTTIGYLLWCFISEIDWQENSLSRQSGQWAVCRWGRCPQDGRWISSRCLHQSPLILGPSPPPSSNVPPPGRSSLLFPLGCHPPHPLDGLHQHHRRRG